MITIMKENIKYQQAMGIVLMALICLSFPVFADSGSLGSSSLLELLSANEIPLPGEGLDEVVDRAVLSLVDPGARLLTREETVQMQEEVPALEYARELPKGILLLKCLTLNDGAEEAISAAVKAFTNQPLRGIAFDLRGAGGWDADELQKVASLFVPNGTPVCRLFSGAGTHKGTIKAVSQTPEIQNIPVVIMVDDKTVGTAEIFAGFMKGRTDVLVTGSATSGASCVREFLPIGDGRFLFVATRWADWGSGMRASLIPDIAVEKNINQEVPRPGRAGRRSQETMDLLAETYADELVRRATDYILARARLDRRSIDDGAHSEAK